MLTPRHSGIGLETAILFAKEGANVLMADISAPALEKALAKVRQLVPNAKTVETKASFPMNHHGCCHVGYGLNPPRLTVI